MSVSQENCPGMKSENNVSASTPLTLWNSSNTDLDLNHIPDLQLHSDIAMATDKVSVMRGLRNKILAGGSTTPRRQTARKSGPRCKLDNLSKFLQQRASMNQAAAVSSGATTVMTDCSPSSVGSQLAFNNTPSPSVGHSRGVSPYFSTPTKNMPDHGVSSSKKRHQRRDKVNGRYFCNYPQCHESYLNLEHIVDHENQHSVPDGKYLECSYVGCNSRFKWRHYLRRHERTHHKLCPTPALQSDVKQIPGSPYDVVTSSGNQSDGYVVAPFQLPFIPTTAVPITEKLLLDNNDGVTQ